MAAPPALAWAQGSGSDVSATNWYDRPMRWAQVAFTEDDPGQYDAQMWLAYFRRIHADPAIGMGQKKRTVMQKIVKEPIANGCLR